MSRKRLHIDIDDLIDRYSKGATCTELAAIFGCEAQSIRKRLRNAGVTLVNRSHALKGVPRTIKDSAVIAEICASYQSGESELSLSKRFNVSRLCIRGTLIRNGIETRNRLVANRLMMSKRTPEENLRNTQAAHAATKGIPQPEARIERIAQGRERNGRHISDYEREVAKELVAKGFSIAPQKAVGRYNIDIAIPELRIAVEIFGGQWHAAGTHAVRFRKRTDYLINAGWLPVIVWTSSSFARREVENRVLFVEKYIVPLAERLRRGEAVGRQEHVINSYGEPCSAGKANIDYRASVGGDKCGDVVRGIDGRFTHQAPRVRGHCRSLLELVDLRIPRSANGTDPRI